VSLGRGADSPPIMAGQSASQPTQPTSFLDIPKPPRNL